MYIYLSIYIYKYILYIYIHLHFSVNDAEKARPKLMKQYLNSASYFTCESEYEVKWFYNKRNIPFSNVISDSENNLHITASNLDNGGEYYCYGYNEHLKIHFLSRVIYILIGKPNNL